jgi:hypothetical protein
VWVKQRTEESVLRRPAAYDGRLGNSAASLPHDLAPGAQHLPATLNVYEKQELRSASRTRQETESLSQAFEIRALNKNKQRHCEPGTFGPREP